MTGPGEIGRPVTTVGKSEPGTRGVGDDPRQVIVKGLGRVDEVPTLIGVGDYWTVLHRRGLKRNLEGQTRVIDGLPDYRKL